MPGCREIGERPEGADGHRDGSRAGVHVFERGGGLRAILAPDLPDGLVGGEDRLQQVLLNLIDNAIKFKQAGRVELGVAAERAASGRARLRFQVNDMGPGIPGYPDFGVEPSIRWHGCFGAVDA
ncbi:ATP-binding protein [Methylobacterium sp. D53M]